MEGTNLGRGNEEQREDILKQQIKIYTKTHRGLWGDRSKIDIDLGTGDLVMHVCQLARKYTLKMLYSLK